MAGTDDATNAVVNLLPRPLSKKLARTFREEQFETDAEVANQAALVAGQAERSEELRLAAEIVDRALAGGQASLGWDETLQVLTEGRAHQLAIAGAKLGSAQADAVIELASDTGALVEVVHGDAEAILEPNGGIGAILRY